MRNLQNIQVKIGSGFETVCPFPVGAIYQSTNSTSPASIYGGSWTSLTDGRFLRPYGSWNNLGGENEHKLTVAEMPSHDHALRNTGRSTNGPGTFGVVDPWATGDSNAYDHGTWYRGEDKPHNNIPAYRTCYCWYRTS